VERPVHNLERDVELRRQSLHVAADSLKPLGRRLGVGQGLRADDGQRRQRHRFRLRVGVDVLRAGAPQTPPRWGRGVGDGHDQHPFRLAREVPALVEPERPGELELDEWEALGHSDEPL
jgi:hypothetical protein